MQTVCLKAHHLEDHNLIADPAKHFSGIQKYAYPQGKNYVHGPAKVAYPDLCEQIILRNRTFS